MFPLGGKKPIWHICRSKGSVFSKRMGSDRPVPGLSMWADRSEITYLFRYDSLAERERLVAKFAATGEGRTFDTKVSELVEEITTRLLIPAPFSRKPVAAGAAPAPPTPAALPHQQRIAPGIHVAGFADRYRSANCGWIALGGETLLIDLPRGMPVTEFLALVAATTGKPARTLALTNIQNGDNTIIRSLLEKGVARVLTSPAMRARLLAATPPLNPANLHALADRTPIGDATVPVDFLPFDRIAAPAGAAVWVAGPVRAFRRSTGREWPACGPRRQRHGGLGRGTYAGSTALVPARVVPGFGSWGGPELLASQRRFLTELRRQVGYHICQGRPHEALRDQIRLPADCFAWTPYGYPTRRRYRARLSGADRPGRPVPRSTCRRHRIHARMRSS